MWMDLDSAIQTEITQKQEGKYLILTKVLHVEYTKVVQMTSSRAVKETYT